MGTRPFFISTSLIFIFFFSSLQTPFSYPHEIGRPVPFSIPVREHRPARTFFPRSAGHISQADQGPASPVCSNSHSPCSPIRSRHLPGLSSCKKVDHSLFARLDLVPKENSPSFPAPRLQSPSVHLPGRTSRSKTARPKSSMPSSAPALERFARELFRHRARQTRCHLLFLPSSAAKSLTRKPAT